MSGVVQAATNIGAAGATTIASTFGSNVTVGNFISVAVSWDDSSSQVVSSVTDSLGSIYVLVKTVDDPPDNQRSAMYYATRAAGTGACTVTVNFSAAAASRRMTTVERSGMNGYTLDQFNFDEEKVTVTGVDGVVSSSITPTSDNQVILAMMSRSNGATTIAAGTGWTEDAEQVGDIQEQHLDQGAAAAITSKWTCGSAGATTGLIVASFKDSGSPAVVGSYSLFPKRVLVNRP